MAQLPRVAGVLSDSTKLKFSNINSQLVETKFLAAITDNFDSLAGWTETDADAKVNLGTNVVTMDGAGNFGTHGLTRSVTRANGYFEVQGSCPSAAIAGQFCLNVHNSSSLPTIASGAAFIYPQNATWSGYNLASVATFTTVGVFAASTTYTVRAYVNTNPIGAWTTLRFTVTGGAYTTETEFYRTDIMSVAFSNPLYVSLQRYASSSSNVGTLSAFRWYSGYATDAPYVTYTHDAGSGKVFDNFDPTALAMPGTVPSTNLTFKWSFDDGVASYSSALTLAQLNAVGKQTAQHRYIRLQVILNSDGSTLVYADKPNSDTATDGVGDFPTVGNVRDTDSIQGTTGTLSSNKVLKSNSTGSGAGNYNDDNLTTDNVAPVAFGIGQLGTLSAPEMWITSITETASDITVNGGGFKALQSTGKVLIDYVELTPDSWTNTYIHAPR